MRPEPSATDDGESSAFFWKELVSASKKSGTNHSTLVQRSTKIVRSQGDPRRLIRDMQSAIAEQRRKPFPALQREQVRALVLGVEVLREIDKQVDQDATPGSDRSNLSLQAARDLVERLESIDSQGYNRDLLAAATRTAQDFGFAEVTRLFATLEGRTESLGPDYSSLSLFGSDAWLTDFLSKTLEEVQAQRLPVKIKNPNSVRGMERFLRELGSRIMSQPYSKGLEYQLKISEVLKNYAVYLHSNGIDWQTTVDFGGLKKTGPAHKIYSELSDAVQKSTAKRRLSGATVLNWEVFPKEQ